MIKGCEVECINCKVRRIIDPSAFEYDSDLVEDHDAGMGAEYEHCFSFDEKCESCCANMEVSISVFEYPIGSIECVVNNLCSGCQIVQMPEFEVEIEGADEITI